MIRAKKSLGQHFLRSERALRAIIKAGQVKSGDTILEIGPGTGVLTRKLLATGAKVIGVEKDDELFEFLKQKFEKEIASGQLNLIHDDILKFIENSKLKIENYKLIANIPYNITGAILKKFLGASHQPELMVLLVQKEVAERIVARDSKPLDSARGKESILSISVKAYGTARYVETVKAGSFAPRPKVDSAIISIENISKDFFGQSRALTRLTSEKEFFDAVRAGFKSKRKKLSSNLSTKFAREKVQEVFQKLNLDENLRAEDVEIETWRKLVTHLC